MLWGPHRSSLLGHDAQPPAAVGIAARDSFSYSVSQNRVTLAADVTLLEDATKVVITPPWG